MSLIIYKYSSSTTEDCILSLTNDIKLCNTFAFTAYYDNMVISSWNGRRRVSVCSLFMRSLENRRMVYWYILAQFEFWKQLHWIAIGLTNANSRVVTHVNKIQDSNLQTCLSNSEVLHSVFKNCLLRVNELITACQGRVRTCSTSLLPGAS